ncbi:MAG: hypothetical protein K9J84_13580 [Bacteroidia bacterium]|nr:hypothetical protein [Bacteroidia bacterium]
MSKTGLTDKVDFICKNLSITDDPDFGCTVEFSDSIDNENENIDYIINNTEKYLLIQRSYPEDIDEIDWYTVETSENETELNQKDKIIIKLNSSLFEINWSGSKLIIGLELSDSELNDLKKILKTRFKDKIILLD